MASHVESSSSGPGGSSSSATSVASSISMATRSCDICRCEEVLEDLWRTVLLEALCGAVGERESLSNPDTNGTEESVLIREVSLFQGLNCMQEQFLEKEKGVLIRGVSLEKRAHSTVLLSTRGMESPLLTASMVDRDFSTSIEN